MWFATSNVFLWQYDVYNLSIYNAKYKISNTIYENDITAT
jgi:hypothetical protein